MKENIRSLERKLNRIIDDEIEKVASQIDDELVLECCDGLLRMENVDRYMITKSEMRESVDSIIGKKPKSTVKMTKTIKILLAAAIIMAMLAIGSLGYAQYKYNIFNLSDHSIVLFSQSERRRIKEFEVGYVPEGFTLNYESDNKYEHSKEYVNGDKLFAVTKQSGCYESSINTEYGNGRITQVNGTDYIEYGDAEHGLGIVWEKDGCQYAVPGNISSENLLKIAVSVSDS